MKIIYIRKFLLFPLFFLTLVNLTLFAQDFSNKGKEFWIPYAYHVSMNGGGAGITMTLYITSDVNTDYLVEIYGVTTLQSGTITAGQVVTCIVPNTYFINNEGLFTGKTVRVTAVKPVVVYSYITQSAISGATVCLPTPVLGREYYSMNYTQLSNAQNANSYFTIIAVEDNTTVEITPSGNTKNGWVGGVTQSITLNKGQIYQVLGVHNNTASGGLYTGVDLTGSKIKSVSSASSGCKRIAVFSGAGKIRIGNSCGSANTSDNLYQQLYPVASWGKKFLTVPSFNRPINFFRILKNIPTTNVYVNGVLIPPASFINNLYYEFSNNTPNKIEADEPVSVTQYFTTQGCSGNPTPYDPEMIVLNPVEQNIPKVTLVSSNLVAANPQHHLHAIMTNAGAGLSSFRLDGNLVPVSSWLPHPGDLSYSYLYMGNVAQGYHTLSSDSGFNALAYGYANAESYGYSAGANVKDLYQYVSVFNQYGTVNFPATCKNTPFYFSMTFPYQPTAINWIFGPLLNSMGFVDVSQSNGGAPIVPTSTTIVNGRTLYLYQLPTSYSISATGTYPIKVIATNPTSDGCGGVQEIDYDIQVFNNPIADFNFSNVCFPDAVQFTDNSNTDGRPIIGRFWDFGDLTTSNNNNPAHPYTAAGPYTVRYSIITDIGCIADTVSHPINVWPIPTASVSGNIEVCQNGSSPNITFTGAVGTAPYTFTYNINGGANQSVTTVSGNSVTVSVPTGTPGTFTYNLVSIQDSSPAACIQNQSGSAVAIVNPLPTAAITGATAVCLNAPQPNVVFTGTTGTAPYTFTYNINGGATQTVITSSGNSVTVSAPTSVSGTFTYNLLSVQDGSSTACLQNQTASTTIIVNPLPTATINGTTEVCKDAISPVITFTGAVGVAPYTFTYNINGGSNQIVTGSGNTAIVPVPTGIAGTFVYNLISVLDASSTLCSQPQSGSVTVVVHPLPTGNFNYSAPSCEQGLINFTDISTPNVGSLTNWSWNFADPVSGINNTSVLQNPSHVFANAGSYSVSLSVINDKGCVSNPVFSRPVIINPKPLAGYIIPEVCLSDTYAQFNDTTHVTSPDIITNWEWLFGDPGSGANNTSVIQHPQHSYSATGDYLVRLITTSNNNCKDTIEHTLTVNGSYPVPNFTLLTPSTLCANDSISLVEASTVFPGNITKIEIFWDDVGQPAVFEVDDLPFPGKVYKHLYPNFQTPATKIYTIRYRVYSGGVCREVKLQDITVHAAPKVQFNNIPDVCYDASSYLINQGSEIGGVPGSWVYSGSGVNAVGLFTPSVVGPGTYSIQYTYSSAAAGCKDSLSKPITVLDTASAKFSFSPLRCENTAVSFNSSISTIPPSTGTITGWTWDFGDPGSGAANFSTLQNPSHLFTGWGTFSVKLFVTTSNGCNSTTQTIPVFVNPLPIPGFSTPPSSCLPSASVLFTNTSDIPDGTKSSLIYLWDFDDPGSGALNSSTGTSPTHIYNSIGPFNVNLQVTSGVGCFNEITIPLNTVHPQPLAAFIIDNTEVCVGSSFKFTDNTNPMDGFTNQWNWTMGDGYLKTLSVFNYIYGSPGTYNISLYTFNNHGCRSTTAYDTVIVHPYPVVDAGPDRMVLESGQIVLEPTVSGNDLFYLWTPNMYFSGSNTILKPTVNGVDDIRYLLTVTARGNCSDTSSVFIKVLKYPSIPNIFSPNGDGVNDKWIIQYLETYPDNTVEIFNRYGQRIFSSVGYGTPWDGTINGKPVPIGTYYYIVNPKNGRKTMSGYVDVIR
ncbi:MAG: PKD domain-containing protein [Chitinophagaceae bacterium]